MERETELKASFYFEQEQHDEIGGAEDKLQIKDL